MPGLPLYLQGLIDRLFFQVKMLELSRKMKTLRIQDFRQSTASNSHLAEKSPPLTVWPHFLKEL